MRSIAVLLSVSEHASRLGTSYPAHHAASATRLILTGADDPHANVLGRLTDA